ncbi:hypothetical protein BJ875DRAFT_482010 [Amylocarpus encephaloides]|uniref:Copper acquisition factor BIM1-like domain-containing protein n=1 Tax=Amylocarpus encephaloides TaxID=45428 RepID=A0A9P7YNY0_9HELO|nr:hypothetical protein BJ875DRAFT_482010 [Amylocarpus encephaloides]
MGLIASAAAHFGIESPEMRGDSFEKPASQWISPCAGVNQTASTNRTAWPLTGGAVSLDLHHPWGYVFVNLGIGTDYPSFNISLTPSLLNVTGNGTFCLPAVTLPGGVAISEGTNASIQVVTSGASGSALYNCADITFTSKATPLAADMCVNGTGVTGAIVDASQAQSAGSSTSSAPASTSSTASAASNVKSGSMVSAGVVAGVGALIVSWLL